MRGVRSTSRRAGVLIVVAAFIAGAAGLGRGATSDHSGEKLPQFVDANTGPQTYELEYRFYNRDIAGTTFSSTLTTATYTRALENDEIRWNGIYIAGASGSDAPVPPGQALEVMEGFQYGLSEEIIEESFYERFPQDDLRDLIKTMVWDGMMIEMFDMMLPGFESLPLNEFHPVPEYEGFTVEMCNWGALEMRDLRLKWTGSSNMHGETCAVILFQSFSNPVDASPIRGRSCYWGQIWVSLDDWEIECLTLNEDVVLEIPMGDAGNQVMDMQREVKFEKTS